MRDPVQGPLTQGQHATVLIADAWTAMPRFSDRDVMNGLIHALLKQIRIAWGLTEERAGNVLDAYIDYWMPLSYWAGLEKAAAATGTKVNW